MKPHLLTLAAALCLSTSIAAGTSAAQTPETQETIAPQQQAPEEQTPEQQTPQAQAPHTHAPQAHTAQAPQTQTPSRLRPAGNTAPPPGVRPAPDAHAGHSHAAGGHASGAHAGNGNPPLPNIDHIYTESPDDHVIGADNAPVTVIMYASVTCSHCGKWFAEEWPTFKTEQIDTGNVRFIVREFPTQPANLSRAGFAIASCAPEADYFTHLVGQMHSQHILFPAMEANNAKPVYLNFARLAGMPTEADLNACLSYQATTGRIDRSLLRAAHGGISGVPAFIVDGEYISRNVRGEMRAVPLTAADIAGMVTQKMSAGVTPMPPALLSNTRDKQPIIPFKP